MHKNRYAVILAAGKGTRMNSDLPKVLMEVHQKPMVFHVLDHLIPLQLQKIVIVVGYKKDLVIQNISSYINSNYYLSNTEIEFVEQQEQLGTGHAFLMAEKVLHSEKGYVLVTAGDMPFLKTESFLKLFRLVEIEDCAGSILGAILENPKGYGRFVRDSNKKLLKIVEEKDASEEIKKIKEVNTGCYVFKLPEIFSILKEIKNSNKQNEYYLPDVIEIYRGKGQYFMDFILEDYRESLGANTKEELEYLNQVYSLIFH